MNDAVDRYLNEVCWAMGGSFAEQQAARDELRAHLRDAAREMELGGVERCDAERRALAELGDPEQVGRSMRASRGSVALRRPLAQPEGALVLERRTVRHLPPAPMSAALVLAPIAAASLALLFLWPR